MCGPCGKTACINGRQFSIKGELVSVNHLWRILEELYEKGKRPTNIEGREMLKAVGERNHVPDDLKGEILDVVMQEFESFCSKRSG